MRCLVRRHRPRGSDGCCRLPWLRLRPHGDTIVRAVAHLESCASGARGAQDFLLGCVRTFLGTDNCGPRTVQRARPAVQRQKVNMILIILAADFLAGAVIGWMLRHYAETP